MLYRSKVFRELWLGDRNDFPFGHPGPPHVGRERVAQVVEDEPFPLKSTVNDPSFLACLLKGISHVGERHPLVLKDVAVRIGISYAGRDRLEHPEQLGIDKNPARRLVFGVGAVQVDPAVRQIHPVSGQPQNFAPAHAGMISHGNDPLKVLRGGGNEGPVLLRRQDPVSHVRPFHKCLLDLHHCAHEPSMSC